MAIILVTGGATGLGRDVTRALLARGLSPRILSHRRDVAAPDGVDVAYGDLRSGEGLAPALSGATSVIHCASDARDPAFATDIQGTRALVDAASVAGVAHLLYISIVGVDRSAYPYYAAKRAAERVVEAGATPWTTLRATQFHDLVYGLLRGWDDGGERLAVAPGMRFQSVERREVAARLVDLVEAGPAGYAEPMRGPETLTITAMAETYLAALGRSASVTARPADGAPPSVFASGVNLLDEDAPATRGGVTWAEYMRDKTRAAG